MMSDQQLEELRQRFGAIKKVNPESKTLADLRQYVAKMPTPLLQQIIVANIPWLSYFAKQQLETKS